MPTRRTLLNFAACWSLASVLPRNPFASAESSRTIPLRLRTSGRMAIIPPDFTGLGYEESSVAIPGLLSATNEPYVQLIRNIGLTGVLRAGGIVADYTSYVADGNPLAEPKRTIVTRDSLLQLRGFLDRVNWTAIWSVNFGRGTLAEAVTEARDVATILGPRLLALELGNEVENYSRGPKPLRQPPYGFEEYLAEYKSWRDALLHAVPGLRFAAPDTAASVDWVERMATQAHGEHVQLLTTHYYRGDQKLGTPDQLLHPDPELKAKLQRLQAASLASGIPWRMCETNSFFGGGRPGLSDTLAGALWTLDYMLLLAQSGCAGVNMETGVNQLGFVSSYSPVVNGEDGHIDRLKARAGASYYGMLAFRAATEGAPEAFGVDFEAAGVNMTTYALGRNQQVRRFVLINKDTELSAHISLPVRLRSMLSLTGDALDSSSGLTFGGGAVLPDGTWKPASAKISYTREVIVPARTALVVLADT